MSEVKWIKISTNMFNSSRKIKQIELMPEGDTILVIWLKLLLLAGSINDGGRIYLTPEIPYTEEMLAVELRRPLNTVRMALNLFVKFGMIEVVDDILELPSWEKYQSVERLAEIREYNRLAKQRSRDRKKSPQAGIDGVNDKSMTSQRHSGIEREEGVEKDSDTAICLSDDMELNVKPLLSEESAKQTYFSGSLGKGVVMLSEDQLNDLLEKLSLEEFDHYVSVVADCILKGKRYKKTHYQAILDMAAQDRKIR